MCRKLLSHALTDSLSRPITQRRRRTQQLAFLVTVAGNCSLRQGKLFQEEDFSPIKRSANAAAAEDDVTRMRTTEDATTSTLRRRRGDRSSQSQMTEDATADAVQTTGAYIEGNSVGRVPSSKYLRVPRSSLWTNFPFILYCMVVAAAQGCIRIVVIFLPARCSELGAGPSAAAFLLTLFGAFDVGGCLIFGFLFDIPAVRRRRSYLYAAVAVSFGAGTALLAAADNYVALALVTCIVAVLGGGAQSQRATGIDELVEPSQVSFAVGLLMFVQGFGSFYGPIVGG